MSDHLPDLTHNWHQSRPLLDPGWWECRECLSGRRGIPANALCPDRVAQYVKDQVKAERARIVTRLRTKAVGCKSGARACRQEIAYERYDAAGDALSTMADELEKELS